MNIERLHTLADHIENGITDAEFNLGDWGGEGACGTVGCIAGHAAMMSVAESGGEIIWCSVPPPPRRKMDASWVQSEAARWLGLPGEVAAALFVPHETRLGDQGIDNPYELPRRDVAAVIRHLASTGLVDWSVRA